jgi:hypothetical protein
MRRYLIAVWSGAKVFGESLLMKRAVPTSPKDQDAAGPPESIENDDPIVIRLGPGQSLAVFRRGRDVYLAPEENA